MAPEKEYRRPDPKRPNEAADRVRIEDALARRESLLADPLTDAFRVFHGRVDGLDGFYLDKLGDVLVAQVHEGRRKPNDPGLRRLAAQAADRLGCRAVYRKVFPKDRSRALLRLETELLDREPWLGTPAEPEFEVSENSMRFRVRPYDGYATGLFLEHRDNRKRVRELAGGLRVLNAFAYTCGFTVAAGLGGAAETVSVDVSRKALDWGRRNLAANALPPEAHAFIRADIFDYLRRAGKKNRTFDLVILDPPTFARSRRPRRVFALEQDLDRLLHAALDVLAPDGLLLLSVNHRGTPRRRLENAILSAAGERRRRVEVLARPRLPLDFRGDPAYARSILVRVGK